MALTCPCKVAGKRPNESGKGARKPRASPHQTAVDGARSRLSRGSTSDVAPAPSTRCTRTSHILVAPGAARRFVKSSSWKPSAAPEEDVVLPWCTERAPSPPTSHETHETRETTTQRVLPDAASFSWFFVDFVAR